MSDHTQGPWVWEVSGDLMAPDGTAVIRDNGYEGLEFTSNQVANKRLIAVSPELLDVLQRMLSHSRRCNWFADRGDEELVAEAEAIVEKATR